MQSTTTKKPTTLKCLRMNGLELRLMKWLQSLRFYRLKAGLTSSLWPEISEGSQHSQVILLYFLTASMLPPWDSINTGLLSSRYQHHLSWGPHYAPHGENECNRVRAPHPPHQLSIPPAISTCMSHAHISSLGLSLELRTYTSNCLRHVRHLKLIWQNTKLLMSHTHTHTNIHSSTRLTHFWK